jgi:hypothetical protein
MRLGTTLLGFRYMNIHRQDLKMEPPSGRLGPHIESATLIDITITILYKKSGIKRQFHDFYERYC